MSFSTIAATRQKEMKASMALEATSTRVAVEPEPAATVVEPGLEKCIRKLASTAFGQNPLSASARLAVGLGLKGVLPCAGVGRPYGCAPSELLPVRVPRSR